MNLLLMNLPETIHIKRQFISSEFPNAKIIGRGSYSVTYQSSRTEEVIKLTVDPAAVAYTSQVNFLQASLFPEITQRPFLVGTYLGEYPLYMYRMEKLSPLPSHVKLMLNNLFTSVAGDQDELMALSNLTRVQAHLRHGFKLLSLMRVREGLDADLKADNFMYRPSTREIVAVDPFYSEAFTQRLISSVMAYKYAS